DGGEVVVDAGLSGSAGQGCERIRAGIDHGDPVARLGEGDRDAARAAAEVEDVEGTAECASSLIRMCEDGGHHRGRASPDPVLRMLLVWHDVLQVWPASGTFTLVPRA